MNLIILFNRIESHTNFNGRGKIKPCLYLNGFGRNKCISRVRPEQSIEENIFSSNDKSLNQIVVEKSEILLIQLSEDLSQWNEDFKNDFITYASNFDNIYVSYHKGPNDGDDIRNGKHRLIESYLAGQTIITTDKYHHDFFMGEEEQLYGVLANAIVENQGLFSDKGYINLIKEMESFFSVKEAEDIKESDLIQDSLTNVGTKYLSEKAYGYCYKLIPDFEELLKTDDGVAQIKNILNKRIIKL